MRASIAREKAQPTPADAEPLAHHHLLAMRFGELIRVMAADPARPGVD
jgi:hypothetical protein